MGAVETSPWAIYALRKIADEFTSRSISDVTLFTCSSWRLGRRWYGVNVNGVVFECCAENAVGSWMRVFWDVTLRCWMNCFRRCEGMQCLHRQGLMVHEEQALIPWRWQRHVPSKHQPPTRRHSVTSKRHESSITTPSKSRNRPSEELSVRAVWIAVSVQGASDY
jgi:hypothetical protein